MYNELTIELKAQVHALEAAADIETYLRLLQDLIRVARKYERVIKGGA